MSGSNENADNSTRADLCRRLEGATTLLHLLSVTFTAVPKAPRMPTSTKEWEILKVLSALAGLFARSREVVAVGVKDSAARQLLVVKGVKESSRPFTVQPDTGNRVETCPIKFTDQIREVDVVDATALDLYLRYKDASFEMHVAVVGALVNAVLMCDPDALEKLTNFVMLASTQKLGKMLRGTYYEAVTTSTASDWSDMLPFRLPAMKDRRIQEVYAWKTAIRRTRCTAKCLEEQLNGEHITGDGLKDAFLVLVRTVVGVRERHTVLERLLKRKSAAHGDILHALRETNVWISTLDLLSHGQLTQHLLEVNVISLDSAHAKARAERVAKMQQRKTTTTSQSTEQKGKEVGTSVRKEEEEDDDDEDVDDAFDVESLRATSSAFNSVAARFVTWLRLLTTAVASSMALCPEEGVEPPGRTLSFEVVICDNPVITVDWERTVRACVKGAGTQVKRIQDLRNMFRGVLRAPTVRFNGGPHCEASLGAIWSAAALRPKDVPTAAQPGTLSRMPNPLNIFGVSKLCCPVCWLILGHLSEETKIVTAGHHGKFFPCTFPPYLPTAVMQEVVGAVEDQLRKAFIPLGSKDGRRPASRMSHELPVDRDISQKMKRMMLIDQMDEGQEGEEHVAGSESL